MKKIIGVLVLVLVFITGVSAQQTAQVHKKEYNVDKAGIALLGYDPVAYFMDHKAVEGKKDVATVYNGITYRFASDEHRQAFKANPAKYEPQYGGWCAYAMGAKGEKVEINPETFKIVDGKLFVFYNKYFNNTLVKWNEDESHLKSNADKNWTRFVK
jgi:YHS domain-containing protein